MASDVQDQLAHGIARLLEGLADERNAPALPQILPGVDLTGTAMLLIKIGTDMDAFRSAARLASWVGVCADITNRRKTQIRSRS